MYSFKKYLQVSTERMLEGHSNFDDILKIFNIDLNEQFHVGFSKLDCEIKLSFISQTFLAEIPVLGGLKIGPEMAIKPK